MQRLASSRRLLQAALAPARANSSLSAAAVAAPAPANGAFPKMPAFDYTPPPYDGPRAEEIFRKRAQFLSPSLFHFYDRPVRVPLPHRHSSLQFCGKDYTATTKKKNKKKNCKLPSDFNIFFGKNCTDCRPGDQLKYEESNY
jgi:hypothetical protein